MGRERQLWWCGVDTVAEWELVWSVLHTEEALVWSWLWLEEGTEEEHSPWLDSLLEG